MKVLAIIGSPKGKGNSYKVTQRIEEKMQELGDVEFNYLFLKDAHLEQCRGCFTCISKGEDLCPLKDDRDKILEEMLSSDGLIFVSPAYFAIVSALMKNFIERFAYLTHRPCLFDQYAMAITTSGGYGSKETLKYFEAVAGGWELNLVHKLAAWTPLYPLAPKIMNKTEKEIDTAARKFYKALKTKKRKHPILASLLHFRFIRYHSVLAKEHFPADYTYFKENGLMDKNYYVDRQINIFKNLLAGLMLKIARPQMRKALMKN